MKRLFIIFFLFPFISSAQKLVVNQNDKFTKRKILQTDNGTLSATLITSMNISFRTDGDSIFLSILGNGEGRGEVGPQDSVFLYFNDESIISLSPTFKQFNPKMDQEPDSYFHQYIISQGDLKIISSKKLITLRLTMFTGHTDFDIKSKDQKVFSKYASLILKNL